MSSIISIITIHAMVIIVMLPPPVPTMAAVLLVGVVAALAGLLVLPFFSRMLRLQQETDIGHL